MRSATRTRLLAARRKLLRWHRTENERTLSWRTAIRDPYQVLVCETMGQQTQAARIEQFLHRFLERFPTIEALARAPQRDVVRAWQGLGYNRRALNLHAAARTVVSGHRGVVPRHEKSLSALPGVGNYTARAIVVFAFNKPVSAVDVNVSRVLTRLSKRVKSASDLLPIGSVQEINEEILPKRSSREWHEALMDFGATICVKHKPKCAACPLAPVCPSSSLASKRIVTRANRSDREKKYHGKPKRLWRGIVLKLIAGKRSVDRERIIRSLHEQYRLKPAAGKEIFDLVLPALTREGFIRHSGNGYRLK